MGFIYEDTKSRFLRGGRAEERIQTSVNAIVNLINKKGFSLEEALMMFDLSKKEEGIIVPLVQERLGTSE